MAEFEFDATLMVEAESIDAAADLIIEHCCEADIVAALYADGSLNERKYRDEIEQLRKALSPFTEARGAHIQEQFQSDVRCTVPRVWIGVEQRELDFAQATIEGRETTKNRGQALEKLTHLAEDQGFYDPLPERRFLVQMLLNPMASKDHMTHCDKVMGDTHSCTCGANEARAYLRSLTEKGSG